MINVLIFGVGKGFQDIQEILDYNKIKIVGFIDNNKVGQYYNSFKILSPSDIASFEFDMVIIASQYYNEIKKQLIDLGINEDKILSYYECLENIKGEYDEMKWSKYCYKELDANIQMIDEFQEYVELIVTGISYAKFGVIEEDLKKKVINLALPRQDLYYDYNLMKYALKKGSSYKNLKFCIIGMSYYTFQYDLSLTKWGRRCITVYNKFLNDIHNYNSNIHDCERVDKIVNSLREILTDEYMDRFLSQVVGNVDFEKFWSMNLLAIPEEERIYTGRETALQDSNKHYPKTVEENKKIFEKYVLLLQEKNITPICVIFPISSYYNKHFSKELKNEFYNIINEFKCKHNIKFFDYFDSKVFNDEDFCDPFHLNRNGAVKFTKLLNEQVL